MNKMQPNDLIDLTANKSLSDCYEKHIISRSQNSSQHSLSYKCKSVVYSDSIRKTKKTILNAIERNEICVKAELTILYQTFLQIQKGNEQRIPSEFNQTVEVSRNKEPDSNTSLGCTFNQTRQEWGQYCRLDFCIMPDAFLKMSFLPSRL